jgi:hypothetical protein
MSGYNVTGGINLDFKRRKTRGLTQIKHKEWRIKTIEIIRMRQV